MILEDFVKSAVNVVWYYPVVGLCLFTGLFFTLYKTFFVQVRSFGHAIKLVSGHYDNPDEHGQITHFQALSTALSGTIGLGNIAGVSIAIELGGPGAIFWMWIVGFFGMATKFVECTLGTAFRDEDPVTGEVRGGPMYYIDKGMGLYWRWLAIFFGVFTILGSFGAGGMFQSNQAALALNKYYNISPMVTGFFLSFFVGAVILGGIERIGKVASKIVPLMCIIYVVGALFICVTNYHYIPYVFQLIVKDAFTGSAMFGGGVSTALLWGVRRAIFSNEAGLGSASIAHAAVKTDYPIREGMVASLGPLIDTMVVCTATAMILIMSGNYGAGMYQTVLPIEEKQIAFGKSWRLTNDVPENSNPVQSYRTDQQAVELFVLEEPKTRKLAMPVNLSEGQSYRFAYFKGSGEMQLTFDRENGERYITRIGEGTTSDVSELSLYGVGCQSDQEWSFCVITGDAFAKGFTGSVTFSPKGEAKWYLDHFETVDKMRGIALTIAAFDHFFKNFGTVFISFSVFLFALSTMLSWSYYGETALKYVFSRMQHSKTSINPVTTRAAFIYKLCFVVVIYIGAVHSLGFVLNFSDLMIGLMVIPNAIGILALSGKVHTMLQDYMKNLKAGKYQPQ